MVINTLLILFLFQIKHLAADYLLQSRYILDNRRIYGHPGGLLHVGWHLAGSAVVLLVAGADTRTLAVLLTAEAVVHYHIDWAKDNFILRRKLTTRDALFWNALGVDQLLHHATYLAMVAYLVQV